MTKADLLSKKGKGVIRVNGEEIIVTVKKYPMKVRILTDEGCCFAGENFVELTSYSPKVSVVGWRTLGIIDYSNCTNVVWDDFYFVYPTSRDCRIDCGKGLLGRGVPVDEYDRWTPDSLRNRQEI